MKCSPKTITMHCLLLLGSMTQLMAPPQSFFDKFELPLAIRKDWELYSGTQSPDMALVAQIRSEYLALDRPFNPDYFLVPLPDPPAPEKRQPGILLTGMFGNDITITFGEALSAWVNSYSDKVEFVYAIWPYLYSEAYRAEAAVLFYYYMQENGNTLIRSTVGLWRGLPFYPNQSESLWTMSRDGHPVEFIEGIDLTIEIGKNRIAKAAFAQLASGDYKLEFLQSYDEL